MKKDNVAAQSTVLRRRSMTAATAVALALTVALPEAAQQSRIAPPEVPDTIQVPAGHKPFLVAHAIGIQSYMCLSIGGVIAWTPVGPQATLFNESALQTLTHFLSPNPSDNGTPDATWLNSRDSSAVWARKVAESSDAPFVAPDAIPWFLLQVAGKAFGPTGGDRLIPTTYIHRVNTAGGKKPATGCAVAGDVNGRVFVPYAADYFFYRLD